MGEGECLMVGLGASELTRLTPANSDQAAGVCRIHLNILPARCLRSVEAENPAWLSGYFPKISGNFAPSQSMSVTP